MTGNPSYGTPDPALTDVSAAVAEFSAKVTAAATGDRLAIAQKGDKRDALVFVLRLLGTFVMSKAEGNRTVLLSSGFSLEKEKEPKPPLIKPETPVVKAGLNPGEIITKVKRQPGVKSIMYMITPDPLTPASAWHSGASTSSKFTYANLDSGKKYWMKACVIGSNNQSVESDLVSYVAQ